MADPNQILDTCVAHVRRAFPKLAIAEARLRSGEGQFNDVLVVNEALIFRFPRAPQAAATLAGEVALLAQLQSRLPLSIPNPVYRIMDPATGQLSAMGYPMIAGEPLWNEALAGIGDEAALDRMASQLAGFLRALHALPLGEAVQSFQVTDAASYWSDLHHGFTAELYPFMRPDARHVTDELFAEILDDLRQHPPSRVLVHGDFGGGNILYDPARLEITGVIDWSFAGPGDPASDIAALSCCGEDFLACGFGVYPEMAEMLPRARLYRGTFALQQALYARRDGNEADFLDGIQASI
jgi:aminoglycoside 2''-phosphotransferase